MIPVSDKHYDVAVVDAGDSTLCQVLRGDRSA